MPDRESGGWAGPAWADVWISAAEVEAQLRCRVVIRMNGSKVVKNGAVVEVLLSRQLTRASYDTIAHVDGYYPSKNWRTMPALLISLIYKALEAGLAHDARPWAQQRIEELPLPPDERS